MNCKELESIIYDLLKNNHRCRIDDMYLLSKVVKAFCNDRSDMRHSIKVCCNVFENWHNLHLPNISTVIRTRARIQSEHPELKDKDIATVRKERQKQFREYYKQNK